MVKAKLIQIYAPDRVGKSTFAEKLAESYAPENPEIIHFGPLPSRSPEAYLEIYCDAWERTGCVISDRGPLEQDFYDARYRNDKWTSADYARRDSVLRTISELFDVTVYVLIRKWDDTLRDRHALEITERLSLRETSARLGERQAEHESYYRHIWPAMIGVVDSWDVQKVVYS